MSWALDNCDCPNCGTASLYEILRSEKLPEQFSCPCCSSLLTIESSYNHEDNYVDEWVEVVKSG